MDPLLRYPAEQDPDSEKGGMEGNTRLLAENEQHRC